MGGYLELPKEGFSNAQRLPGTRAGFLRLQYGIGGRRGCTWQHGTAGERNHSGHLGNALATLQFHWNGVLTRQANVQSKSPLIAKFARAMVEAIHIYKTDRVDAKDYQQAHSDYRSRSMRIVIVEESGLLHGKE
jgi:hypothetical protein